MHARRGLYRRGKRLLAGSLRRSWQQRRGDLELALRRFLRAKPRSYLWRLVSDHGFLVAAAASLATNAATALPPVQLSDVSGGDGGFVMNGIDPHDASGVSVSAAGDVNGDGLGDVIVGARLYDTEYGGGELNMGESYVVFGKADGLPVNLSDVAAGVGGFVIHALGLYCYCNASRVSGAGDVNGDGLDDVIVGAPGVNSYAGASYVVFGKADGTAVHLADIANGAGGFVINGIDMVDQSGVSVSDAGDVNGDGLGDVIIGAHHVDLPGISNAGQSYVVFGKADTKPVELADVAGGAGGGFAITGIDPDDESGFSVSGAGDVNGDGLSDVIVGAHGGGVPGKNDAGESYVVFGKADGDAVLLIDVVAGTGGFVIRGADANDRSGHAVSGAGDVNGDGLADVLIGAYNGEAGAGSNPGQGFVVFGKADGTPVELSGVEGGAGGFVVNGADPNDNCGQSVSGAGDIDGDGLSDVIVGSPLADPGGNDEAGESYVVFGKADGAAVSVIDVIAGSGGFAINGIDPSDFTGRVSGAGDVNGDGRPDLIIGAASADPNGVISAGESYVVFNPVVRADIDGSGVVGIGDLLLLLAAWGPCPQACPPYCPADIDGDCAIGIVDLLLLLGAWR